MWEVRQTKYIDQGRPALLAKEIVDDLLFLLSQRSTAHLDEMKWFIYDEYDIEVSESILWRG